jgi:Dolichyl-phosphate-mannose-protein mannosyltransferase
MRTRTLAAASLLVVVGAWLRLHNLQAMEFKGDERQSLEMAIQFLNDHPWSSTAPWPSHGLISSNGVGNAPLFTWMVAAFWALTPHPVGVTALIALVNVLCLVPLWFWARRRMDEQRALLTLALAAVSPFAVLFSRKIWPVDVLLPGLLAVLWSIEWLREGRFWRGVALAGFGILLISQLHQSGLITAPLLLVAFLIQRAFDRRRHFVGPIPQPSPGELAAVATVVVANVFYWWTYVPYLLTVPAEVYANRPRIDSFDPFEPQLFAKVIWQIVPRDALEPFNEERVLFRGDPIRWAPYYGSLVFGAPLAVYGVWRWLRAPARLPVVGIWWCLIIVAFALARIPTHAHYVLALMPLPLILAAGAFDGPLPAPLARAVSAWRWLYVVTLLALTVAAGGWLAARGGSSGDYGVTFEIKEAQARAVLSRLRNEPAVTNGERGEVSMHEGLTPGCQALSPEVRWIAGWLEGRPVPALERFQVCGTWESDGHEPRYRWAIREAP